ncbi:ribosome biogenesis protein BMS1 [Nematocida minor]|uniref:ribosome biogenesis protein BMS1 n=1 Tax=Nematocida minor TaxID=1912983 RepID=UPI002220B67F|nr:ribosome biogenesis protein BMS1 [Nematocida minor]KAI5190102.1 ribosome biogenesis protein BMS1 [Nematocida minor]
MAVEELQNFTKLKMDGSSKEPKLQSRTNEKHLSRFAAQKKLRYEESKYQTPIVMRKYGVEPAPPMVVIFGPPSSGKTLLMNSIVRHYTRQKIEKINGVVTLMASKLKRISFYECPANLATMTDSSKVADLMVLVIDAQIGLEIETFEMLNLLKTHGFPKIMCVITKLDKIEGVSQQRALIKKMKKRIWTEICDGIKIIPMTKIIGGRYLDREVTNAARHIAQMKYRPFMWRASHPYIVADQLQVEETPKDTEIKSDMQLFSITGYVRGGVALKKSTTFHLPGIGDYCPASIEVVDDPCPLTNAQKRKLSERKKPLYAPMSDIRGMRVEQDAIYLEIQKTKEMKDLPSYYDADAPAKKEFKLFAEPSQHLNLEPECAPEEYSRQSTQTKSTADHAAGDEGDAIPENCVTDSEDSLDGEVQDISENQKERVIAEINSIEYAAEDENSDELDEAAVRRMFRHKKETEEDYIERFNEKYREHEKDRRDVFTQEKEKLREAEEATMQMLENHSETAKEHIEGIAPGKYVKLLIALPKKVTEVYTPENIFILGANKEEELSMTFIQGRVKRHKWFKKTLKTKEAHYISMGWRRFQTTPVFSLKDPIRNRMLKYIPDTMTCNITFYAPTHPPGTSFTVLRKFDEHKNFRIAANGVQTEIGGHPKIMKKLKLIGYPSEIKGHTVFVKDMFHTQEEAARYEGVMLKTVSGIRGQIKKAGDKGVFRASFEAQIKMSEIIFLPCFFPLPPAKIYLNAEDFSGSGEIGLLKEIREKKNIEVENNTDSLYKEVEEPVLKKLRPIPKALLSRAPLSMLKKEEEVQEVTGSEETKHKLKILRELSHKVEQMKQEKAKSREARIKEIVQEREEKRKKKETKMKNVAQIQMQKANKNKKHKGSKGKTKPRK